MIPTCNLSMRREIFTAAGCFQSIPTKKLTFKSEDVLLCHKIRSLGYKIQFDPTMQIYHCNRTNLDHFLKNQISLGFSSAVVRKAIQTRGSALAAFFPLVGLIPFIKMTVLLNRYLQYDFRETVKLAYHLPMIFIGSCFYTFGFIRGMRSPAAIFTTS